MNIRSLLLAFFVSSVLFGCSSSIVGVDLDSDVPQDTVTEIDKNDRVEGL
jgi:hypothetical protein